MDLTTVLGWIVPTLIGALIAFLTNQIIQNKSLKQSMIALLRGQIVSNCEQYNKTGYLPDYARYTINELGTNYSKLGGNHGIQELISKTNQLPPIKITKSKQR
jgi:hypothetical protein